MTLWTGVLYFNAVYPSTTLAFMPKAFNKYKYKYKLRVGFRQRAVRPTTLLLGLENKYDVDLMEMFRGFEG